MAVICQVCFRLAIGKGAPSTHHPLSQDFLR